MKLPLKKWIVSGYRFGDPVNYGTGKHKGVDLKAKFENVYSPFNGTSAKISNSLSGLGMKITEGNNQVRFWHLSVYNKLGKVKVGDIIAQSGNSGTNTTGPHLHIETYINGSILDPEKFFMIHNILFINSNPTSVPVYTLENVRQWFANYGYYVVFYLADTSGVNFWAKMTNGDKSYCDTKDTYHTPNIYDMGFSWTDVYGGRTPDDVIIHEILHALYEDADLSDIHDYNWGVADNIKVVEFLINSPNLMKYVILDKEQFLIYEPLKIAFNIADPQELDVLIKRGLIGLPEAIDNLDGYLIYPLIRKDRLGDIFGFVEGI